MLSYVHDGGVQDTKLTNMTEPMLYHAYKWNDSALVKSFAEQLEVHRRREAAAPTPRAVAAPEPSPADTRGSSLKRHARRCTLLLVVRPLHILCLDCWWSACKYGCGWRSWDRINVESQGNLSHFLL